jgi:hypothetical protein
VKVETKEIENNKKKERLKGSSKIDESTIF